METSISGILAAIMDNSHILMYICYFRAQPDYVEEAGEHPPVISPENIPRMGVFPKTNVTPKPFILKEEDKMKIGVVPDIKSAGYPAPVERQLKSHKKDFFFTDILLMY